MEKKIPEKKERERWNHLRHLPYCTTFAEKKKLFKKKNYWTHTGFGIDNRIGSISKNSHFVILGWGREGAKKKNSKDSTQKRNVGFRKYSCSCVALRDFLLFQRDSNQMGTRILKKSGRNSDDSETVQDCHSVYYATHSHTLTRTHTRGSIIVFDQERRKWILLGRIFHWENGEQSYTQAESFCETNVFFLFCWRHESLYIDITRTQLNSRDEEMERKQNVHSFYLFWETGSFDAGQKCQRRNKTTTLRRGPEDKVWWTNRSVSNMAAVQERKKNIQRTEFDDRNTSNDQSERKERQNHQFPFFTFFFFQKTLLWIRDGHLLKHLYIKVCVCVLLEQKQCEDI